MNSTFKNFILACLLAACTLNIASAQTNKKATIDSLILNLNKLGLFNGNVLVADDHKIVYKAAIGFADASRKTKVTTNYRFEIGSIAKEFNAVGIMMLQEQGKLNVHDKLSKYLPQLPAWADKIAIINLLQYTSGLPDVNWTTVKSDADNMADLMKLQKLDFEPGTHYAYNNNNVFLQRRIIEKITGLSFSDFVRTSMLKPLKMDHSIIDPTESDALIAKAYNDNYQQDPLLVPISGWVNVTLDDFYKWAQAISAFKLINPASTAVLLKSYAPNAQAGLGGGLMDGNRLLSHTHDGSSYNYQALLTCYVPKGRVIILMSNNKQGNVYEIANAIQNILDGKPYVTPKRSILKQYGADLDKMNGPEILAFYKKLKTEQPTVYGFDDENTLNEIGYSLMGKNIDAAITVFEYNTVLFPKAWNVFDSLGEAYYNKGDKQKALINYEKSLQLNPANANAKQFIQQLKK